MFCVSAVLLHYTFKTMLPLATNSVLSGQAINFLKSRVNCGFNTRFVCYICQFTSVPFAGRRRRPVAVER